MHIDSYFSLSNSDLKSADFVIFGIPYDRTQSFRSGSRFAPNEIRVASWNLESYSTFFKVDLEDLKIYDAGNINVDGDFECIVKRVESFLSDIDLKRKTIVVLGGEHTVSYAVVRALKDDFCYLVFDAHLDLRESFDGEIYNHACTCRRIAELGVDIVFVGSRSYTRDELEFARSRGFKIHDPLNFRVEKLEDDLSVYDRIYLSIDFDVFDPSYAPAVSTPEPFGMNPVVMLEVFDRISKKVFAIDLVEIVHDSSYVTPMLSAKLIFEFIASKALSSN